MGRALYRKYRSKSLDEIIGQTHITDTLRNAINDGNISHAYLFTGPRGVGKTSIARILAYEINGLPYDDDGTHLDIIEIDAASNRRIDEIRELRERVHVAPTSAKYKVYIIDEVHMLTKEAFNALLKTLEEPPAHAVFILATTEAHKLPDTIVSRTQRYSFKPVAEDEVIAHLKHISKQEGFSVDEAGLSLIAQHGEGSFRDSISLLDQMKSRGSDASLSDVQTLLGIAPDAFMDQLIDAMSSNDSSMVLHVLALAREQGYQAPQVAKQLSGKLRESLVVGKPVLDHPLLLQLLRKLLLVSASHDQMSTLELALLDTVLTHALNQPSITPMPVAEVVTQVVIKDVALQPAATIAEAPKSTNKKADVSLPPVKHSIATSTNGVILDSVIWEQALDTLKKSHNTLYSVARMAEPTISGDEITLVFKFAFHQKRLSEVKNQEILGAIVQKLLGKPIIISCVVGEANTAKIVTPPNPLEKPSKDTVSTISNIFGGAEVLES